jgi:hypothetical protein
MNLRVVFQNYFGDAWNVVDFAIVIGSILDIIISKLSVRTLHSDAYKS